MKQKKIAIIMAGILAAAAAMTGCAEQNKTETQVDYCLLYTSPSPRDCS